MITGSYNIKEDPSIVEDKDKGVREFFEMLGYSVSWDSNYRLHEKWFEIIGENGLACQIDMNVPLEDIIMDIVQLHQGKPGISKSNYKINGPDIDEMKKLFKVVHDYKVYGVMPDGQMILKI